MTDEPTSALLFPDDVVELWDNIRPAVRRHLSFRDLDQMRRPYMARINALEQERDRLRAAIEDALMMGISRDSYALIVSIRRRLQEALDHD